MDNKKYSISTFKYLGRDYGTFNYEISLNKSMVHTGRLSAMEYGMNEQSIKERVGKVRYYFRRLYHALINKNQFD